MARFSDLPLASDANIVAYYKCEDVNANIGTFNLTNNNTVTFTAGKYENGADGGATNTNKYLGTTNNLGITGGSITLSGWVRMNTEIGTLEQDFIAQQDVGLSVNYRISYQYNTGTPRIAYGRYRQGIAANEVYATVSIGITNFSQLALTYDNTNLRGYLNGTLAAGPTAFSGNGTSTTTSYLTILNDGTATTFVASAVVDDVVVANRALSADEIQTIYAEGNGYIGKYR